MKASDLFTLPESLAHFREHFSQDDAPWEWLPKIKEALAHLDPSSHERHSHIPPGVHIEGAVVIHPSVKLPPFASITGPAWIGADTEVRPGAYIRGNVIIGERCVIGNSSEYKNALLMDDVQTPHYNYVGDSILGNGAHLGAGVILANLRLDKNNVPVTNERIDSGLRKLGAILADHAEAGCNSVLQPGTILAKRAIVMPLLAYSGYLAPGQIAYERSKIQTLSRRD